MKFTTCSRHCSLRENYPSLSVFAHFRCVSSFPISFIFARLSLFLNVPRFPPNIMLYQYSFTLGNKWVSRLYFTFPKTRLFPQLPFGKRHVNGEIRRRWRDCNSRFREDSLIEAGADPLVILFEGSNEREENICVNHMWDGRRIWTPLRPVCYFSKSLFLFLFFCFFP